MDFERFDMKLLGSESMAWQIVRHEDHTPVLKKNKQDKESGRNGWLPGKKQRHLARIPIDVIKTAEKMGYDMSPKSIYKFLADYPQYMTVPYILSPKDGSAVSQGRIIIK